MRLVHLVEDGRRVSDEGPGGVQVVVGDEQQVSGPRAEQNLVLEGHDHQLIQLQASRKNSFWVRTTDPVAQRNLQTLLKIELITDLIV